MAVCCSSVQASRLSVAICARDSPNMPRRAMVRCTSVGPLKPLNEQGSEMAELTSSRGLLAARLRELRISWGVTQRQLSDALGLSGALVSSWENGSAVPPEERLNSYARFFATRRSTEMRPPSLIPSDDLTT